jgi:hypothetical protein
VPVTLTADLQHAGYVTRFTRATNEGSKTLVVISALMAGVYMKESYERVSTTLPLKQACVGSGQCHPNSMPFSQQHGREIH